MKNLIIAVFALSLICLGRISFAQVKATLDVSVVKSGLTSPVSMAVAPDGRIFIVEKGGRIMIVKNDVLLPTPFVTLPVNSSSERGVLGIVFDQYFTTNRFIYVYYTRANEPIKNRVSRFTASATNPDIVEANSEKIILDDIPSDAGNHNGGALNFGTKDGKLYIAVGDGGTTHTNAQLLTNLSGKILRINRDGTIPSDNPFSNVPGARKEIWAYGFRNPFSFSVASTSGTIYVNDVGQNTWEEVNSLEKGGNYGWPVCEGPKNTGVGTCTSDLFKYPIYSYNHTVGKSITGSAFFDGAYYFGDFVGNFIKSIDGANTVIKTIAADSPVDIKPGLSGELYYISFNKNTLHKLTTEVQNGGSNENQNPNPVGASPVPTIITPVTNSAYSAGNTITYSGSATDAEDGTLPASAFSWTITFQHDSHAHPFMGPITGVKNGSFTIPTTGETEPNVWYRITLTVTDSAGNKNQTYRDIDPNLVQLNFATQPSGEKIYVDGQPFVTPFTKVSVAGLERTISVDGTNFSSWSNNGAQSQTIRPATTTSYTAYFTANATLTNMQQQIDAKIKNLVAGDQTKNLWTTRGDMTKAWVRNTNVWTGAIDWSGVSPWNENMQYRMAGTLVSPRHLMLAKHYQITVGKKIIFVTPDNQIITRTIAKIETIQNADIAIAVLDQDVPNTIKYYPILPRTTWTTYLKGAPATEEIPILLFDQEDKIGVHTIKTGDLIANTVNLRHAKGTGKRAEFDEPIVTGDSGNPAFVLINNAPVLIFTNYDFTFGPHLSNFTDQINAAMTRLGGNYQLSVLGQQPPAPTPNLDIDGDGILIPTDKCPNTPLALRTQVNKTGCVRPKISKFNIKPAVEDSVLAVPNVQLGITNVGKITFNQPVDLARDTALIDLDTNVIIAQDKVEIKSSVIPELNKPATITLYNIDEKKPRILRDGVLCNEPQCKIESFVNGALTFTVTGFSIYTVQETPATTTATTTPAVPEKPRTSGGGGGGGGRGGSTMSSEQLIQTLTAQLNLLIAQYNLLTGGGQLTTNITPGMRNDEVTKLQKLLNTKGVAVPTTGFFGAQTTAAVKKFQISKGISPTGSIGPLTRAALNK